MPHLVTGHLGATLIVMAAATLLAVLRAATRTALQRWRERSALEQAPQVYASGGDPADVLRAMQQPAATEVHDRRVESERLSP